MLRIQCEKRNFGRFFKKTKIKNLLHFFKILNHVGEIECSTI